MNLNRISFQLGGEHYFMKDYSQYSDEELMKEVKAGNMLAFDELYRKYIKRLYRFSYSILKSREEAENIIQNIFLNLWQNREKPKKFLL